MGSLIDDLMEENWIMSHVRPCAERTLGRQTMQSLILPLVNGLLDDKCGEREFTASLAREFEKNQSIPDLRNALSCIENRVVYELETRGLTNIEGFCTHICSSLLGKFFYLHCKNIGYARVMA